jgi:acetyltransferase-like isoleucine patch superfamily enzyme
MNKNWLKIQAKRWLRRPQFATHDVQIGRNVQFGRNVVFRSKRVRIGDGCIFHDNVTINADEFIIGDYGTIYHDVFMPGPGTINIGHNAWIGNNCILDGMGGLQIGHNFCLAAYGQLWTHAKFGDVMMGNKYDNIWPMTIGNDVWLMARVTCSAQNIEDRCLVLPASVVTKNLLADHTYGGHPAQDMTEKLGSYIDLKSLPERKKYLESAIELWAQENNIRNIWSKIQLIENNTNNANNNKILLNYEDRTYTKTDSFFEYELMRALLPNIKLIPSG